MSPVPSWPSRKQLLIRLEGALANFSANVRDLPGIEDPRGRQALAMQMIASLRRLDYTQKVQQRDISGDRVNPDSDLFDPERAAMLHARAGRLDEAFWLTFLSVHFGKHAVHGWRRVRDVYSGLGTGIWTWERVSGNPDAFRAWLRRNADRIGGAFGNHRKYETLNADSPGGTAAVVASYVDWVGPGRSHEALVRRMVREGGNDPHRIFHQFYDSMQVLRFGRLGKFDFLALLGRLGLAPISPGSAYLKGATGPLRGARLLFGGNPEKLIPIDSLQEWLDQLDRVLQVGMQVMEDSLCNWQKSPLRFVHFRG